MNVSEMSVSVKNMIRVLMAILVFPLSLMAEENRKPVSEKPHVPDYILQNIFEFSPFYSKIVDEYKADVVKNIGSRQDEESIAKNLHRILREFDDEKVEVIFSESFSGTGMGQAIMNRLLKAAGHKIIHLEK